MKFSQKENKILSNAHLSIFVSGLILFESEGCIHDYSSYIIFTYFNLYSVSLKVQAGVSRGQTGVKLLRHALWLLNLVGRTPYQSVMH